MAYFKQLTEKYKPSTLWAIFSMLRTTIKVKKKLDISKYFSLSAFMKVQSDGYQPKKSKVLSAEHVQKFLTEAPDETFLLLKVG